MPRLSAGGQVSTTSQRASSSSDNVNRNIIMNTKSPSTSKINKNNHTDLNNHLSNSHVNRLQSVPNDVFNSPDENKDGFETPKSKNTSKRNHSSTDSPDTKKMFITANRYAPLTINNNQNEHNYAENENDAQINDINVEADESQNIKQKLPPPIIVKDVLDFAGFRNKLINLIGPKNFTFKSSTNNLKIQTTKPEFYRETIRYLKEKNAQYHTYQSQEDKAYRIVIRNLHPTTPTEEIGIAIEEIGFSVRQVTNVRHKTTKINLPIFFVDLEPATINTDIFSVTSLLHTKVIIEEPHKRTDIIQCMNCQDYGHSRKYCSHTPRCVRCGEEHPTSYCTKTKDLPAKCALCMGNHPANYKGCQVYKNLQHLRKPTSNKNSNYTNKNIVNNVNNVYVKNTDCEATQQPTTNTFIPQRPNLTYAQATSPNNSSQIPNNSINENALFNFLNEFKSLINPLLSLLTTVLNSLLSQNVK